MTECHRTGRYLCIVCWRVVCVCMGSSTGREVAQAKRHMRTPVGVCDNCRYEFSVKVEVEA